MEKERFVALIPVRGGSKSIPLKNIRPINGRPLVYWTLDAALQCPAIAAVYLCTDSDEIRKAVEAYRQACSAPEKLVCIDRPAETATDTASTESVMLYFANQMTDFSHLVLIQATSPLLTAEDLSQGLSVYQKEGYDSLLSVVRQKRFIWQSEGHGAKAVNYDFNCRPRRQEFDGYLVENGAFYVTRRELLLESSCRLSGRIGTYEMPEESYFEIDEPSDWVIIEQLLKKKNKKQPDFSKIKMLLSDCDGVMTDGGMYYSENGDELKKFNTKDGMGVQLLREKGILFGIITGEESELVKRRARKLKACECLTGVKDKLAAYESIKQKYGLKDEEIAYVGDDVNDISVLKAAGVSFCPQNAVEKVKRVAEYATKSSGGEGVLREICYKLGLE